VRQGRMNLSRDDIRRLVDIEATVDDGDEYEDDTDHGTSAEISSPTIFLTASNQGISLKRDPLTLPEGCVG
jgi:hypothetical protein